MFQSLCQVLMSELHDDDDDDDDDDQYLIGVDEFFSHILPGADERGEALWPRL